MTRDTFRLIELVSSPKAESFKFQLAILGKERIDKVFDSEIAINRVVEIIIRETTAELIYKRVNSENQLIGLTN